MKIFGKNAPIFSLVLVDYFVEFYQVLAGQGIKITPEKERLDPKKPELIGFISCVAKMAKCDGDLTYKEIKYFESLLSRTVEINSTEFNEYLNIFSQVCEDEANLSFYVQKFGELTDFTYEKGKFLFDCLYELAIVDGEINKREEKALKSVIKILRLSENTYQQVALKTKYNDYFLEKGPSKFGTGFFINNDGILLTNYHVTSGASEVIVRNGVEFHMAELIENDTSNDLSLLQIQSDSKGIPFYSENVQLGKAIFTYGFPKPAELGLNPKVTKGIISSQSGPNDDVRYYQIDAPIQEGNSGGPILDSETGGVLGIVCAKMLKLENVNYAIKGKLVDNLIRRYPNIHKTLRYVKTPMRRPEETLKTIEPSVVQIFVR